MSGRKQHFIPRLLLREFGTPTKTTVQVKVFRADEKPFTTAVEGVGAERDFYSTLSDDDASEPTLDDKITEHERVLRSQLQYLLELDNASGADPEMAAAFVVHLITRNDHFRRAATAAAQALFQRMQDNLSNEDVARRMFGIHGTRAAGPLKKAISNSLDERPEWEAQTGLNREQLEELIFSFAKSNFSQLHEEVAGSAKVALKNMMAELAKVGAEAQRNALDRELIPPLRVEQLRHHTWKVLDSPESLILPDCIAISTGSSRKRFPLMMADEETDLIWLPVSKARLIVGAKGQQFPKVDFKYLNRQMAQCSWDFFVCDAEAEVPESLVKQVRKRMNAIIADLVSSALAEE